jgi:hypothetical protein
VEEGSETTMSTRFRHPFWIHFLVGLVVAVLPLVGTHGGASFAQEAAGTAVPASNLATQLGLNAGVSLQELASGTTDVVPVAPAVLRLEEVTVEPGQSDAITLTRGPELLYIQSGELTAEDNIGFRATLSEGRQVLFHEGFGYSLTNESGATASFLRLTVRPMPLESNAATPSPSLSDASTASSLILFQTHIENVPASPATLFLGRMTWDPGIDSGQYWHDGTFGMMLESGQLTVQSPSGLPVELKRSAAEPLPSGYAHNDVNPGPDVTTVLVFAFVNADEGLLRPGTPASTAPAATPTS